MSYQGKPLGEKMHKFAGLTGSWMIWIPVFLTVTLVARSEWSSQWAWGNALVAQGFQHWRVSQQKQGVSARRFAFHRWEFLTFVSQKKISNFRGELVHLLGMGNVGFERFNKNITRWWIEIFLIFTPTREFFPIWFIFCKWVETTN